VLTSHSLYLNQCLHELSVRGARPRIE
jgi:hypothetical protein